MLLLITGSSDATSDLICQRLGDKVFRLNYDIFNDYELEFTTHHWKIRNPTGHSISSEVVTSCFWWKTFHNVLENQDQYVIGEVKYIFRELYNWCRNMGIVKGNPFDFHNHHGKITLMEVASRYFLTPKTLASFGCAGVKQFGSLPVVAKSLSSAVTDNLASLLTTEIDTNRLPPDFPWYLQEKIISDFDITVFVCGDKMFAYERSRKDLKGLDWRGEQSFDPSKREWLPVSLSSEQVTSINGFCSEIGVQWGRLDLMSTSQGWYFLEFNANGQWVFLDYLDQDGLISSAIDYIYPEHH